ncbi:MAG: P44/Msp2 family outer membrane protein [Legionella sp.]|nr:MAG: P44/Msp2 family outer membrane protein [Legionella sp.]
MKKLVQCSVLSSLLLSSSVFALNPVLGFYGGLLAQGSRGNTNIDFMFTSNGIPYTGQLKYNPIGGGGGIDIGYKMSHFRAEIEALFNTNSYDQLRVNGCNILSPTVVTPTGTCPAIFVNEGLGFNGSTTLFAGMFNGYFDIYSSDSESIIVPYIGLGVGTSRVKNVDRFIAKTTNVTVENTRTSSASAAQVIVGLSYYMDDYTWAGLDYRYITTKNISDFNNSRYGLNTVTLSVNFAFSKG